MNQENTEVRFVPSRSWKNTVALSVDVEDYFMSPEAVPFEEWAGYPSAIHTGMEQLLELFQEYNAKATFFFVGWLAERYPEIVHWTRGAGHEIATHTYTHHFVTELGPKEFEASLLRSLDILQSLVPDQPIRGHRAPAFSLPRDQKWPFDILRGHGIAYDSSINPHATYLYGDARAPRFPYAWHGIVELPPAVVEWAGFRLPAGGGGTLRVLPEWYLERARLRYQAEGFPPVIYIHPWEMVPGHPPLSLPWKQRWIHYTGLDTTRRKLRALLQNHTAISLGDYYQKLMENHAEFP
ncbi:MAG: polysaccharide deacetylase family protein [bacterium]